ncbi:MAG: hypothetical protein JWL72_2047 [Ilumatobacteraceae bacterium]|nr:hypothetical protein [Ilumatobacteraceae bacterium]MCU1396143.1 hypothetical protein [Ilumatobacteraceae bacterium]
MSEDDVAELAIRRYLQWLSDPASIVDTEAIDAAEAVVRDTTDVIAKLKALSRVEQLRSGDSTAVRAAFLDHAKAWGDANQISPASWIRLGVPPEVLREAGVTGNRATVRPSAPRPAGSTPRPKAAGVSIGQISAHVATLTEPFVLTDLADSVGGSPMTVRKAVEQLVADRKVRRLGPDPTHNGRGRAPIRYQTITG